MPRNLSPAVLAATIAPQKSMALFLELAFSNETLWLWSGIGPATGAGPAWDPGATFPYGQVFTGMGWMGRIDSVPQTSELTAENITLMLSGIPVELLGDVINSVRLTGTATLWLAFFSNGVLLPDPLQLWLGALDVPTVTDGADTCSVSITVENALLALNSASNRRFTTLDQQLDFPGDTGFDYVSAMQDLYLPYPDGTTAGTNITPSNLDAAPAQTQSLVISPAGPQQLVIGLTLQMKGVALFVAGPYANAAGTGFQTVTSAGLWSSSDTSVATVTNGSGGNPSAGGGNWGTGGGLVTAVGPGNCTITFFFGSVSCSFTFTAAAAL
jgi:hypothetical protein